MDVGVYPYSRSDPLLIDKIVNEFLSQGKFDKLRKECMSDADTKPAYQNLQQRVENTVTQFLKKQVWKPDLNKNQLRDSLRKHILESKFFDAGINRIVDQVVNPNVLATVFLPEVEEVVYNYLSIPKPSDKCQKKGPSDDQYKSEYRNYEYLASHEADRFERRWKEKSGEHRKEYHMVEDSKGGVERKSNEVKTEVLNEKEKVKVKAEPEEETDQTLTPVKMEITSDESEESLSRMAVDEHLNDDEVPPVPDSDDSVPLEINEKSLSESRDSEDSIMNQMSPISQGRLTPDLEEEIPEVKTPEVKTQEEKKPLTFVGRIPKIKQKEDVQKKEKFDSSDESDCPDEKKKKYEKDKKHESSRDKSRHKDQEKERRRERHKKSSSSSSSKSSSHKSSHRDKDSKSKRKEEDRKKSKPTDDHGKERNKKEDRRSTDRDSNERDRGRSSGSRTETDNKKREKEQPKTEEPKDDTKQKEVETECEIVQTEDPVLDYNELYRTGDITRLEFPKQTDDFYVKFNSTGFRYFEDWEKNKLDCEEEFKEFVDEAEKNLSLLSDDESDSDFENLVEENRKTIKNLLKGIGNFRRSLMFDPVTLQFYKWTNNKFYLKFRKKEERRPGKMESDESIKENINRGEKNRVLHLKLLNRYKKKAMRLGKPRRRQRRPESGGIKEKNENFEPENTTVPEVSLSLYRNETVTLPESPEETREWPTEERKTDVTQMALNLPPSPDSDDVNTGINPKPVNVPRKRIDREEGGTPKKQTKRNYSQKYDNHDLYKPRPILHGSRTRGRERGLHRDIISLDSPVSR